MAGHKAIVAEVSQVVEIPGADRVHLGIVLGERVVISKEWGVGKKGVLFPVDVQLSEQFCFENNLNRKKQLNKDETKAGFFEQSRRVRTQPFLKVRSEGFFVDLSCFDYTGEDVSSLAVGTTFDELGKYKICQKYINEATKTAKGNANVKQAKANYAPFFEKHVDSDQFKHYAGNIVKGSLLSFHHKVHGTSARMAYTLVNVDLPKWKQHVNKWVKLFPEQKWEYVVGTRNVVLKTVDKEGFHGSESFRWDVMDSIKPWLEKGMTVYGEIAGYANGKSIMPKHSVTSLKDAAFVDKYGSEVTYKYGCKDHEHRFHIYRITQLINGVNVDMTQKQMEKWCNDRGILTTLEVHPQVVYDGDVEALRKLVDELTERPDVLTEDYIDPSHVCEGIILRADYDGVTPKFYKSKSFVFKVMEGLVASDVVDTEDAS